MHLISENQIVAQVFSYPIFGDAVESCGWQTDAVNETDFIRWMAGRMAERGVTQDELRQAIGLTSQSAVSNILKGKRRVKVDERAAIEVYLGKQDVTPTNIRWIPLIGLAPASSWREAITLPMGEVPVRSSIAGRKAFAVEVSGDSMSLLLPEGGWAVIDPDQTHLYDRRVYLIANSEHESTLKRYRSDPARFEPVSDNPEHETIYVQGDPIQIIGRVVSYGNDDGL